MSSTSSSASHWHVITPHTRPLNLTILELTPLALTLSLTLAPSPAATSLAHSSSQHLINNHNHAHGPPKPRKKTRYRRPDSDDELTAVEIDDDASLIPGTYRIASLLEGGTNFKDLLSHGVVVNVNGQPWSRIVAHVSDPDEEDDGVGKKGTGRMIRMRGQEKV